LPTWLNENDKFHHLLSMAEKMSPNPVHQREYVSKQDRRAEQLMKKVTKDVQRMRQGTQQSRTFNFKEKMAFFTSSSTMDVPVIPSEVQPARPVSRKSSLQRRDSQNNGQIQAHSHATGQRLMQTQTSSQMLAHSNRIPSVDPMVDNLGSLSYGAALGYITPQGDLPLRSLTPMTQQGHDLPSRLSTHMPLPTYAQYANSVYESNSGQVLPLPINSDVKSRTNAPPPYLHPSPSSSLNVSPPERNLTLLNSRDTMSGNERKKSSPFEHNNFPVVTAEPKVTLGDQSNNQNNMKSQSSFVTNVNSCDVSKKDQNDVQISAQNGIGTLQTLSESEAPSANGCLPGRPGAALDAFFTDDRVGEEV